MNGVYWNYEADPHLLIAGGTGGGKNSSFDVYFISPLQKVGHVDICDPNVQTLWE